MKIESIKIRFEIIREIPLSIEMDEDSNKRTFIVEVKEVLTKNVTQYIPYRAHLIGYFLSAYEGDVFEGSVRYYESRKGGRFYTDSFCTLITPSTIDSLIQLSSSQIRGVKEKTMRPIVEYFGVDMINILSENPDRIKEVKGLSSKKRESIVSWCKERRNFDTLLLRLQSYGVSAGDAVKIYEKYGGTDALYQIEKNTYSLVLYDCLSFLKVDKIVYHKGEKKKNSEERLKAALWAIFKQTESNGNMGLLRSQIVKMVNDYVDRNGMFEKYNFNIVEIDIALNELLKEKLIVDYIYKIKESEYHLYYRKTAYTIEYETANLIKEKLCEDNEMKYSSSDIDRFIDKKFPTISDKQREAVHTCLSNRLSILTGGPGCGKTFTINVILSFLESIGEEPLLMAPTGKAAVRMKEMTHRKAVTIHNALRLMPHDSYLTPPKLILSEEWVIIDEASMIDASLLYQLMRHVSQQTHIIFSGDVNQLPSVGYGEILDQLLHNTNIPSTMLDKIFRQSEGSYIVEYAHAIKDRTEESVRSIDLKTERKDFVFIEASKENVSELIKNTVKRLVQGNHVSYEDIMVLTPMHKSRCGTIELNNLLQQTLNPKGEVFRETMYFDLKVGDRVMETVNSLLTDNKTRVYNGEVGVVTDAFKSPSEKNKKMISVAKVLIDGNEDPYRIEEIENLILSYAITIHKSQGSEADFVIMPFIKDQSLILTNKLIYTALTRAKKKFIGIGEADSFYKGCLKADHRRVSLLSYMINEEFKVNLK